MPRQPRQLHDGACYHIIARGNNRADIFLVEDDWQRYGHWLLEFSRVYDVDIYHYCLMTNHMHLVVHIQTGAGLQKMLQRTNLRYAQHMHQTYQHVGHVWQDRFKSYRLPNDAAVLACGRYVERNPVEAQMVATPAAYAWSSVRAYVDGVDDPLVTLNPAYLGLGTTSTRRQQRYAAYLEDTTRPYHPPQLRRGRPRTAARTPRPQQAEKKEPVPL
jgi:putative transposase